MSFSYIAEDLNAMASEAAEHQEIIKLDNEMRASEEFFKTQQNLTEIAKKRLTIFRPKTNRFSHLDDYNGFFDR